MTETSEDANGSAQSVSPAEVESLVKLILEDPRAEIKTRDAAVAEAERRIREARDRDTVLVRAGLAAVKRETVPTAADPEYLLYQHVRNRTDPISVFHSLGGVNSAVALRGLALFERWDAERQDALGYAGRAYALRNTALGHERAADAREASVKETARLTAENAAEAARRAKDVRLTEARRLKALLAELETEG